MSLVVSVLVAWLLVRLQNADVHRLTSFVFNGVFYTILRICPERFLHLLLYLYPVAMKPMVLRMSLVYLIRVTKNSSVCIGYRSMNGVRLDFRCIK